MTAPRSEDDALRVRALEVLGPLGDALAREALERGIVLVEHDVRSWQSSHGTVRGHRVVVALPEELLLRIDARHAGHATRDSLAASLAAAMAERAGQAMVDVRLAGGDVERMPKHPYRDPRAGRR
jgi:acetylornithine deacetylase/succinyl-diaminopimelate desuccinylase-like protein